MMRVKAGPLAKPGWFEQGEYVVLGLQVSPAGELTFTVEESKDNPGAHRPGEVIVTDGKLPQSWRACLEADGGFSLYPEEWSDEFWEAYENGDAAAWETYRRVKTRLEAESR